MADVDPFLAAVSMRLHDACLAREATYLLMPEDPRCPGWEAHYVDVLNVLSAAREQPVADRMAAMGMTKPCRECLGVAYDVWAETVEESP